MAEDLVRMEISDEEGVFTVRRAGRQVAAAVGLEHQDQVRVATALSEVGRELYACSGLVSVAFRLDPGGTRRWWSNWTCARARTRCGRPRARSRRRGW